MRIHRFHPHHVPSAFHGNAGTRPRDTASHQDGELHARTLTDFFTDKGFALPRGFVASLEETLVRAGLDPATLDRSALLRAYLVHRHGLPLTRATVIGTTADQPSVLGATMALMTRARLLLATSRLSGGERQLVDTLVADVTALFNNQPGQDRIGTVLAESFVQWAGETGDLLRALEGDHAPEVASVHTARLLDGLKSEVARITGRLAGMDGARGDTLRMLGDEVARLETNLASLVTAVRSDGGHGWEPFADACRELFRKRIALLRDRWPLDHVPGSDDGGHADALATAARVRVNGTLFEWRLLAWYRAGRDPRQLASLYRHDLKGILLAFTGRFADADGTDGRSGALDKLAALAHEALGALMEQQVSAAVGTHDDDRAVMFELPLADTQTGGHARVKVATDGGAATESASVPRTVSFAVDTTAMGAVHATMRIAGTALSLDFELGSDDLVERGERMADEVHERLARCGYDPAGITFRRRRETAHTPADLRGDRGAYFA